MAQLVERILGKDEVPSSALGISTMKTKASLKREAFLFLPFSSSRSVWHRDRSGPARMPLSEWLRPAVLNAGGGNTGAKRSQERLRGTRCRQRLPPFRTSYRRLLFDLRLATKIKHLCRLARNGRVHAGKQHRRRSRDHEPGCYTGRNHRVVAPPP